MPHAAEPTVPHAAQPTTPHAAVLLALTRLMSRWSSLDLQRKITAESNVTLDPTAVQALYLLGIHGGAATPSVISDEMHLSRPSTSKMISRLTQADLVTRTPHPTDRRSAVISFTPSGQSTFDALFAAGISMLTSASRDWDDNELHELTRLLTRFVDDFVVDATNQSI